MTVECRVGIPAHQTISRRVGSLPTAIQFSGSLKLFCYHVGKNANPAVNCNDGVFGMQQPCLRLLLLSLDLDIY